MLGAMGDLHGAVVVAVIPVRVMEMSVDQIVDMVAVRYGFVSAAGTVPVVLVVSAAGVIGRAAAGIAIAHLDGVLVDVIAVGVMEMAVVQVVDVVTVPDRGMAARRAMLVRVVGVNLVIVRGHGIHPFLEEPQCFSPACAMALRTSVRT